MFLDIIKTKKDKYFAIKRLERANYFLIMYLNHFHLATKVTNLRTIFGCFVYSEYLVNTDFKQNRLGNNDNWSCKTGNRTQVSGLPVQYANC